MDLTNAIILGLLQGVAEFLPISSSGHLTLAQAIMELKEAPLTLNLALHVATLIVVIAFYRKKIVSILFPLNIDYIKAIVICSVPTGILGILIKKFGDAFYRRKLVRFVFTFQWPFLDQSPS